MLPSHLQLYRPQLKQASAVVAAVERVDEQNTAPENAPKAAATPATPAEQQPLQGT